MLIKAQSSTAAEALELVSMLQARFVEGLETGFICLWSERGL